MEGRIGRLHCRYRVLGTAQGAARLPPRLDQLVRDEVAGHQAEALATALGDDPTVYVLRRVEARPLVLMTGGDGDPRLAQRWGERLAGAVVHTIAHDAGDRANLVRFADQADYVAAF